MIAWVGSPDRTSCVPNLEGAAVVDLYPRGGEHPICVPDSPVVESQDAARVDRYLPDGCPVHSAHCARAANCCMFSNYDVALGIRTVTNIRHIRWTQTIGRNSLQPPLGLHRLAERFFIMAV